MPTQKSKQKNNAVAHFPRLVEMGYIFTGFDTLDRENMLAKLLICELHETVICINSEGSSLYKLFNSCQNQNKKASPHCVVRLLKVGRTGFEPVTPCL